MSETEPAKQASPARPAAPASSDVVVTLIAIALTFGTGATDVASFTRLGNVFTGVMTGNIVLLGLSVARGSLSLAGHTTVAFFGYVIGVASGTRIVWWHSRARRAVSDGAAAGKRAGAASPEAGGAGASAVVKTSGAMLAPHVTLLLSIELALLVGFMIGWEATGTHPAGWVQLTMLAAAAAAMGMQSSAVKNMELGDVSTTYLTGTLTGLVAALALPGEARSPGVRRPGVLVGLAVGAGLSGALIAKLPAATPVLPIAGLITALVLGSGPVRANRR